MTAPPRSPCRFLFLFTGRPTPLRVESNGTLQLTGDTAFFTSGCNPLPNANYGQTLFPYYDDLRTDAQSPDCVEFRQRVRRLHFGGRALRLTGSLTLNGARVILVDPAQPTLKCQLSRELH